MAQRQGESSKPTNNRKNHGQLRNHGIHEAHIRRFAQEGLVYTFDFYTAQRRRSYTPLRQSPGNATVVKGLYTDEYEKKLSQQFEQGVKEIMDKIIEEGQLAPDERIRLSRYIYAYRVRSTWMLRFLQSRYGPYMRDAIQDLSDRMNFVQESLHDAGEPIDEEFFEEAKDVIASKEDELNDAENVQSFARSYFSEGSQLNQEPTDAAKQLASLPWRMFISKGQPFVLGDFFFEVNGQDQPIFEMYCPISATHCLFISRYAPHPGRSIEDIEYMPVDGRTTRAINVRTVAVAERYVISGQDLPWVSSARKTPAKKHLQLTIPNLKTEQLVGGYIARRCPKCWWRLTSDGVVDRQLTGIEDDTATVYTFIQQTCSNPQCPFSTTFQDRADKVQYPLGPDAIEIRRRLCPSDRDQPPLEDMEQESLLKTSHTPPPNEGKSRDYSHDNVNRDMS